MRFTAAPKRSAIPRGSFFDQDQVRVAPLGPRPRSDFTYAGDLSTVTVHIRRLREKIEKGPVKPQYVKTVWGVGYKFEN